MKRLWDAIRRLMPELPAGAQRLMVGYVVSTSALALLDIAALGMLALIMTPMMTGAATSLPLVGQVSADQYPMLLVIICSLMIAKAVIALIIQWFATRAFARWELAIGDTLFGAYIRSPWIDRLSRSSSEVIRLADVSVSHTINGVVQPALMIPQLGATALAVALVLFAANPMVAIVTIIYLGIVGVVMYFGISRKAVEAGQVNLRYSLKMNLLMKEMMATLKEVTLRDKAKEAVKVVHASRERTTQARANAAFLSAAPQRLLEGALVGGILLIGSIAYLQSGMQGAIGAVAVFGVAGFRLIPSLVSFQGIMTNTSNALPHLEIVLRDIETSKRYVRDAEVLGQDPLPEPAHALHLDDVTFTYPTGEAPAVDRVSLDVPFGSSIGLVGSSGSGKSTLIDMILGLIAPDSGSIRIDDRSVSDVLAAWRSRVGYVPQQVALFDGTIAQNVALTWEDDYDEERVRRALDRAQLTDFVAKRPGGIQARIGESGMALSGGQRQRLGIARALYSDPLVLVLDEATSALDTTTEEAVTEAISRLSGELTIISVAHRLSTIRDNDQICFMRDGRIVAQGTFDELVEAVPDFKTQALLAGLIEDDA